MELGYIGDGVYLSHDGYQFWLAVGSHKNRVVALEPPVLEELLRRIEEFEKSRREAAGNIATEDGHGDP